jgi:hypothetical protein
MTALAIHAGYDSPGKGDVRGAFRPEAKAWAKMHGAPVVAFDNRLALPARRKAVESILAQHTGVQYLAFFCHGLRRSLQTGHTNTTVNALADAITDACASDVRIALYACSTGKDDAGFAAALRDALAKRGRTGWVDAHTTAGHTTRNPWVRRFYMDRPGAEWIVARENTLWRRWVVALKTDLRFRFPMMPADDIRAEATKVRLAG